MRAFGVGIVGAGVIGEMHAQALQGLESARLVGVAEIREEAGRGFAKRYSVEWYPRIEELLTRPDMDAVALCTPSGLHSDQAVQAARAGKHVITEKPMAINLEGADRMIRACHEAGVTLSVIFQSRFNRDAVRLKRAVEAGLFGRLVLANVLVHWYRSQEYYDANDGWRGTWAQDGGGVLINQSIHSIDLLQWIVGPIQSLSAHTGTLAHKIETEDTASATLRFQNGALGVIQGTTSSHKDRPPKVEIIGSEGSATLEGAKLTVWEPKHEREVLTCTDLAITQESTEGGPFWLGHQAQYRQIFAALQEGREPPVPGGEARKAVEIVLAIYRSACTGDRVSFPFG
jgi:predicted dehydrogenase